VYPEEVEWTNVTKHDIGEYVDVANTSELLVENAFKATAEINSPGAPLLGRHPALPTNTGFGC
jgi:hypothetical protein